MTLAKLIGRLEQAKDKYGGQREVKVADDEGEWGFGLNAEVIDDPKSETGTGVVIYLDMTMQPE